jgi:hypothetical protein
MKKRDLLKLIQSMAKQVGLETRVISGGNHDKVFIGQTFLVIPRHREINEYTARAIRAHAAEIITRYEGRNER